METFLIYLLKSAGSVSLFLIFYFVLLRKETFFKQNRVFLISGLLLSIVIPFISFTSIILVSPISITQNINEAPMLVGTTLAPSFNWSLWFVYAYAIGVLLFFIRLCLQLLSLRKLIVQGNLVKKDGIKYVETDQNGSPFSFFNYVIYNPSNYSKSELDAILIHERVHVSQYHSIDILVTHLFTIFQWFNPFIWSYKKFVGQNLEFIADTNAIKESNKSDYQYLMLKDSIDSNQFSIVSPFFNSLIKKRIVMLNKSKSNKRNLLKLTLIVPGLAIFLMSFNTKKVYVTTNAGLASTLSEASSSELIEITINKNTSDKELKEIKKNLIKKNIDFSYTVVHNSDKEITNISIDFTAKKENGKHTQSSSSFDNGNEPIDPIHIVYDEENNSISMGSNKNTIIDIHEDSNKNVWVHSDNEDHDIIIEIVDTNGIETISVNGKEMSRADFDAMKKKDDFHEKHLKIIKSDGSKENSVFIMSDSDEHTEIHVDSESDRPQLVFISEDGKVSPLIVIDGKISKKGAMNKLSSSDIESISVYKGVKAKEKFGKKGKNGVLVIKTKKN